MDRVTRDEQDVSESPSESFIDPPIGNTCLHGGATRGAGANNDVTFDHPAAHPPTSDSRFPPPVIGELVNYLITTILLPRSLERFQELQINDDNNNNNCCNNRA